MLQASTLSDSRKLIRQKIRPYPRSPQEKMFWVGWVDYPQTFEQIMDALRPKIVQDLLNFRKLRREYIQDLLQQGWLRLWKALQENDNLLVNLNARKAADFVANRCGVNTLRDYLKRYTSYHQLSNWQEADGDVYEDSITEIVIGSSLKSTGKPGHALFALHLEQLLDIEQALRSVATWCDNNLKKLAALYYLTTSVSQVDAGRIAGLEIHHYANRVKCPGMLYWTRIVLKQLQTVLANYRPIEPNRHQWRQQLKAGHTAPIEILANKYIDDTHKLLALYVLTTSVSRETIVKECGINDSALWYAMKQLRQELRCMYAQRISDTN